MLYVFRVQNWQLSSLTTHFCTNIYMHVISETIMFLSLLYHIFVAFEASIIRTSKATRICQHSLIYSLIATPKMPLKISILKLQIEFSLCC